MEKTLNFETAHQVVETYSNRYENVELAEEKFGVKIVTRDNWMKFEGEAPNVELAAKFFETMGSARKQGMRISNSDFINKIFQSNHVLTFSHSYFVSVNNQIYKLPEKNF